jgi:hypothetical protein
MSSSAEESCDDMDLELTARLERLVLGKAWWADWRRSRPTSLVWHAPDAELEELKALLKVVESNKWHDTRAAEASCRLLTRVVSHKSHAAAILAAYPALTQLMQVCSATEELTCWCCDHLHMLAGATTERAILLTVHILDLLTEICRTQEGRRMLLTVQHAPMVLSLCCSEELLADRAVAILDRLAKEIDHGYSPPDSSHAACTALAHILIAANAPPLRQL